MINWELFLNLIISHLISDFPFQKDSWVKDKRERGLMGLGIWKHAVVVLLTTMAAFGCLDCVYILLALTIVVLHVFIDLLKARFSKNNPQSFAVDQLVHIAVLFAITCLISKYCEWHQWGIVPQGKERLYPLVVCVYLFCLSPANYIIREILEYCHVQNNEQHEVAKSEESKNRDPNERIKISGILIGSMERFLILTFILLGNFDAAGLTIAAKSLLRFKDNEGLRTEYLLIGTLLSIMIAVLCALVVFNFGMEGPVLKKP